MHPNAEIESGPTIGRWWCLLLVIYSSHLHQRPCVARLFGARANLGGAEPGIHLTNCCAWAQAQNGHWRGGGAATGLPCLAWSRLSLLSHLYNPWHVPFSILASRISHSPPGLSPSRRRTMTRKVVVAVDGDTPQAVALLEWVADNLTLCVAAAPAADTDASHSVADAEADDTVAPAADTAVSHAVADAEAGDTSGAAPAPADVSVTILHAMLPSQVPDWGFYPLYQADKLWAGACQRVGSLFLLESQGESFFFSLLSFFSHVLCSFSDAQL